MSKLHQDFYKETGLRVICNTHACKRWKRAHQQSNCGNCPQYIAGLKYHWFMQTEEG